MKAKIRRKKNEERQEKTTESFLKKDKHSVLLLESQPYNSRTK